MSEGCRINPEWVPEAYKSTERTGGNIPAQTPGPQQALPQNGLYGHHKKRPAWQRFPKK